MAPKPFTQVHPVDLSDMSAKDQFQIICFENNNAAFFADTVVLVEGDSDYLLLPHIARTLDPSWDDAQVPVPFARITGKGNIRRYRQFFARFGVRVPVIADLDLLLTRFQHIDPDDQLKTQRDKLLSRVDELIAARPASSEEPSGRDAREALDSGELRGLWRQVRQRQSELEVGACTLDDLSQAVDEFFAWQRKSDRIGVLQHGDDDQLRQLKWQLLEMLRAVTSTSLNKAQLRTTTLTILRERTSRRELKTSAPR